MNIYIDGDKNAFNSKTSINKFKMFIKNNKTFDIQELQHKYIHYNYKLELVEKTNEYIKFKVSVNDRNKNTDTLVKLKDKLKLMKDIRIKNDDINIDILYNKLKKLNANVPLPSPSDALKDPDKYKPIIASITATLSKKCNANNNYIKYFKLLSEHIGCTNEDIINTDEINQSLNNLHNTINDDDNNELLETQIVDNIKGNINEDSDTEDEEEKNEK
jgi:hypothetical protein